MDNEALTAAAKAAAAGWTGRRHPVEEHGCVKWVFESAQAHTTSAKHTCERRRLCDERQAALLLRNVVKYRRFRYIMVLLALVSLMLREMY